MSYFTFSVIGGRNAAGEYVSTARNGRWKPETAARVARRMGIVNACRLSHHTGDLSGKGRGGQDHEIAISLD